MSRTFNLDLHTHPIEALKTRMGIKGILDINEEVMSEIVKAVKKAGLNGIAITEHNNFNQGLVTSYGILEKFTKENLIILPGTEIDYNGQQFIQLYIPDRVRRRIPFFQGKEWFLILAHPGYYNPLDIQDIKNIPFDAVEGASLYGEFPLAEQIAQDFNLPIVKSSDARKLEDIGRIFTELESN